MSDQRDVNQVAVDRRTDTVGTQQPGYAATQQVTTDVAAERRLWSFQINRIVYTVLGILEILLGLRFVLKLIAANPDTGFSAFIYGVTGPFLAPFNALLGTPTYKGASLEVNTLIAMVVYALIFWVIARVIKIATDRPTARMVTTSTNERPPSGPAK